MKAGKGLKMKDKIKITFGALSITEKAKKLAIEALNSNRVSSGR